MQKVLFILIALVLVLTTAIIIRGAKESYEVLPANLETPLVAVPFEDWKEYSQPEGKFKVELPVLPQHAVDKVTRPDTQEALKYDMYVSEKSDGTIFMVNMITYPTEIDDTTKELVKENIIKEMLNSNPQNKLIEKKDVEFQNYKAVDFAVENNDYRINAREFIIDRTLYLLGYIAKKPLYNKTEYEYFLKSFQLQK